MFEPIFALKVHCIIALAVGLICFAVWAWIDIYIIQWPWFVYPICVIMMSLSLHYYCFVVSNRSMLALHFSWFCIINTAIFLSWSFQTNHTGSAWFIYPFGALSALLAIHYHWSREMASPHMWIKLHITLFAIFNTTTFIAFLDYEK